MAKSCILPSLLANFFFFSVLFPQLLMAISPAVFLFGDSLLDVGTNNYISGSRAISNFPHNGVDFANSTPTGRFSNGFNCADFLAKIALGPYAISPSPFFSLVTLKSGFQKSISRGVNFASGGSGLLDVTGQTRGVISFTDQTKQFATVCDNLTSTIGPVATQLWLSKSMFFFSSGGNDLLGYISSKSNINLHDFILALTDAYKNHITALYNLGARKFGILNVPPIGCIPSLRIANTTGGCLEDANTLTQAFNYELYAFLSQAASQLPEIKYSFGNAYEVITSFTTNPRLFGFKDVESACCGSGKSNAENACTPTALLCANRNEYLFWDRVHPTQFASKLAMEVLSIGGSKFATPINFSTLEKL